MKMHPKTKKQLLIGGISLIATIGGTFGIVKYLKAQKYKTTKSKTKEAEDKKLVERKVYTGDEGYVNIRSAPNIDNKGFFDNTDNIIRKASSNPVGTIIEKVNGKDGFSWYKIKLTDSSHVGYVREDAIKIK